MQLMNDDELRNLLRAWKAPPTPSGIEGRVLYAASKRGSGNWIRWLARGSVSVPVPALICALALFIFFALRVLEYREPPRNTLAGFQPVKQLKPRIIRSTYENP